MCIAKSFLNINLQILQHKKDGFPWILIPLKQLKTLLLISFHRYRLKEQVKLVIQENKFLLEQKYIQKDTVEELTRDYLEESKLLK